MFKPLATALLATVALAACATTADAPLASATAPLPEVTYGPPTPMNPAEFQGASVLNTGIYQSQATLPACNQRMLPRGEATAELAAALPAAKAYSDEQKGYGLIVLQDGQVVHESYAEGQDESMRTASASMAKSVMALMMGIAIERGMVGSVDEPLDTYLTEWAGDPRGDITIKQALQMASGLGPSDFMGVIFAPDVFVASAQTELADAPGTVFAYNNAVSQLLGEIIDRQARGEGYAGYADFLLKELWCPMGGGEALLWVDPSGKTRTYAGLHAGIRDYAKIGELIRNKGRVGDRQIVPAAWIAEMVTPSQANGQYGYQVWLGAEWTAQRGYSAGSPIKVPHSEPYVAKDLVYFDGFGGQRVYIAPSHGITVARVGETNLAFDDAVIPNLLVRALED